MASELHKLLKVHEVSLKRRVQTSFLHTLCWVSGLKTKDFIQEHMPSGKSRLLESPGVALRTPTSTPPHQPPCISGLESTVSCCPWLLCHHPWIQLDVDHTEMQWGSGSTFPQFKEVTAPVDYCGAMALGVEIIGVGLDRATVNPHPTPCQRTNRLVINAHLLVCSMAGIMED